jgi:prepilin-type N-terminal cleavage/methylation domain-containing protein
MRFPDRRRRRSGFTLIELLVSTTIVLTVLGISARLFQKQSATLSIQAGTVEAQQGAIYSTSMIERELRMAGVGVVDIQPILVQAAARSLTFNSDLVSRIAGDPGAVYIDVDADSSSTLVFRKTDQKTLPLSTTYYPESTYYRAAGVTSGAETIAFWFSKDSSVAAANEFIFWRRVNGDPPRVVARGIRINSSDTVFQYFKKDSTGANIAIAPASLPLVHAAKVHGSTADTGKSLLTDSIRSVRVRFTTVYRDRKGVERPRRLDVWVNLMNAGLVNRTTCGEIPLGVVPTATNMMDGNGNPFVRVSWVKSGDEGAGEKDVERYAIYRRLSSVTEFTEPIASIPAGSANPYYDDTEVSSGQSWLYGVAAQDCTPRSSPIGAIAAAIIIP